MNNYTKAKILSSHKRGKWQTMLCPIKRNSNTIEFTVQTSCYCVLDLLCVKIDWKCCVFQHPNAGRNTQQKVLPDEWCLGRSLPQFQIRTEDLQIPE